MAWVAARVPCGRVVVRPISLLILFKRYWRITSESDIPNVLYNAISNGTDGAFHSQQSNWYFLQLYDVLYWLPVRFWWLFLLLDYSEADHRNDNEYSLTRPNLSSNSYHSNSIGENSKLLWVMPCLNHHKVWKTLHDNWLKCSLLLVAPGLRHSVHALVAA